MQDFLPDDQNTSPAALKTEALELRNLCKELIAKNEEYAGMILALREQVQLLKDEIAILKGQKPKPKIPPNRLDNEKKEGSNTDKEGKEKRPGSAKKSKTASLEIDETRHVNLENPPPGAIFKGWSDYTIQDITIEKKVILLKLATYVDVDGRTVKAPLPAEFRTGHFGPKLIAPCLYPHFFRARARARFFPDPYPTSLPVSF